MLRTEVPIFYRPFFCRIRRPRMVVTVAGLRAILAGYLMQAVFRNSGEGPAKRWAVKNAENRSPHLLPPIFLPDQTSANGCALPIKSSCPLPAVLLIGKRLSWAGPCRAVGIGWVEAIGAEPRNFWQENFIGRKIFRRLTSPLAATLPAGVI